MDLSTRQNILLIIRALYFCLEEQWSEIGKDFQVTPAQQHLLFLLSVHNKSLTPTQISELGCWHPSTVTRLLKPLKNKGYVEIAPDAKKPRFKRVVLTREGHELLKKLITHIKKVDWLPLNISHISEADIQHFILIGQRILEVHKGEAFKYDVLEARMEGIDYA